MLWRKAVKRIDVASVPADSENSPLFIGKTVGKTVIGTDLSSQFMVRNVAFEDGARNKLHSHTSDQILFVTQGQGIIATQKDQLKVAQGDVVFIPAGEKHWHGAAQGASFAHLALVSTNHLTTQHES
jgi:quercetin dioxygenase-like cupin family protein